MQVAALLEAVRALADLHDFRLDLGHKERGAWRIVERDEVANVDEVCPRGRQDNQLCHKSGLVSVVCPQLGKDLIGRNI